MVYSKGRILLQALKREKAPSLPLPLRVSEASHKAGKGAAEVRGGGGGPPAQSSVSSGAPRRTTARTIVRNERQTVLVLCCLKLGGARVEAERGELVFLQVPGFKKLQAFLHSQAFLQTVAGNLDSGSFQLSHETCSITDFDLIFLSCRLTLDLSFFKKSGLLFDFIISYPDTVVFTGDFSP